MKSGTSSSPEQSPLTTEEHPAVTELVQCIINSRVIKWAWKCSCGESGHPTYRTVALHDGRLHYAERHEH